MLSPFENPTLEGTPFEGREDVFWDWGWQLKNRIDTLDALEAVLELSQQEREAFLPAGALFRFAVTPYYGLLADRSDPSCPIRRQFMPRSEELTVAIGQRSDPLGEEELEAAPNLIHRYPDRALLLATDRCPIYCRFCTRRRIVGHIERQATKALFQEAIAYIRAHAEIREVIISGGDALMLGDRVLANLLADLRAISHVDLIRLATRVPVTCPMRVTAGLVEAVRAAAPVCVLTHFNHPRECTRAAASACARFVDSGVLVYNQTVLLRGVNDHFETIRELNRRLVSMRVTPYYLHQCDLAHGIEHFRTSLNTGLEIMGSLRGFMSGLAVPRFCVDVPGGFGKVVLEPESLLSREGGLSTFRTYSGHVGEYPDPRFSTENP